MRFNTKYIFGLIIGLFASCSNIAEDERLIYVEPAEVKRGVLIEDFTGQSCVNCPEAASLIHDLQTQYGEENVIAVGIYSGPFGAPENPRDINLVTETGVEYWNRWFDNSTGQPVGKINRNGISPDYGAWTNDVMKAMQSSTNVDIEAIATYNDRDIDIVVEVTGPINKEMKLSLWLTEDNIIGYQKLMTGKPDRNYVHNHVFRQAVNGTWGESFVIKSDVENRKYTVKNVSSDWNLENMNAVVFVTNSKDEDVQQVIQVKLQSEK